MSHFQIWSMVVCGDEEIECPECGGGFADDEDDFFLEEGYDAGEWNNVPEPERSSMTDRHGGRLTDAELDAAIGRARDAAHGAPKSIAGSESIAWAMRSREYRALLDERDRRGNT